jgi:hypothetical protein
VSVDSLIPVHITGADTFYCIHSLPVTLSGSPAGGAFSGPGMSGNIFDPSNAGAGFHDIIYTYNGGLNCNFSDTAEVHVGNLTTVSFTGLDSSYCTYSSSSLLIGNPVGGSFSGPGMTGSTFYPANALVGTNTVVYHYSDINNCTFSDTVMTWVDICLGTGKVHRTDEITIYPNPNNGVFNVDMPSGESCEISIFNSLGEIIFKTRSDDQPQITLDLQKEQAGIYFMHMVTQNDLKVFKLVIR